MVFGMPHRGRINVLANVLRKPYEMIIAEFEGSLLAKEATGDGDVKYHLGYSRDHTTRAGRKVHLSLAANPSHLEAIDPIIEGMVRAKQQHLNDAEYARVVPVLMHGDAAFTGQGVVAETLGLSELDGYRTGGTVHIIVNNQIGFTTPPEAYRFTPYPSDVAKIIQAPVFHVNGDDPEAAVQAARLAIGFRERLAAHPRGAAHGGARADGARGAWHRLELRRGARHRRAPARGHPGPHERAGHLPRHLQPAPRRPPRRRDRRPVRSARQHPGRPGAVPRHRQHAVRERRPRLRVRHEPRRSAPAGRLGGAVRRLHQRRAGGRRPVPRQLGVEVAAHERPRAPPPARLRGPRPRALERAPRALPPALRRGQHAGLQPDHAGAVLPRPPPPDAPELPEAARADDPEEPPPP